MSRHLSLTTLAAALALLACSVAVPSLSGVTGSGDVVSLDQAVSDFDRVVISNAFHTTITQGDAYAVVIRIDDNLQEHLQVEQQGRTLSIGLDADPGFGFMNSTLEADITMPSLVGLEASGAVQVVLVGFVVDGDLALEASGASRIEGELEAGAVDLNLSGASSASLTGAAQSLAANASGASTADLGDFQAVDVSVVASGASTATVQASGTLDAEATGASHVTYFGDPTLRDVEVSGASTVEPG